MAGNFTSFFQELLPSQLFLIAAGGPEIGKGAGLSDAAHHVAAEEQEGDGLVGRFRGMSASEYDQHQMTRTLRDVVSILLDLTRFRAQ